GGCDWGELRWLGCWLGCWPCRRWAAPRLELEIHILHQRTSSDCGDPGRKKCHPAECRPQESRPAKPSGSNKFRPAGHRSRHRNHVATLFSTTFAIIGLASLLALVFNERSS